MKTGKRNLYKMVLELDRDIPIQSKTVYRYYRGENRLQYSREDGTDVKVTFSKFCGKYILEMEEKREAFPEPVERREMHEISPVVLQGMGLIKGGN